MGMLVSKLGTFICYEMNSRWVTLFKHVYQDTHNATTAAVKMTDDTCDLPQV